MRIAILYIVAHVLLAASAPLFAGLAAASFTVRDAQGKEVHFDPQNLQKPLILTFYRGGWCPYCNLHHKSKNKKPQCTQILGLADCHAENAKYSLISDLTEGANREGTSRLKEKSPPGQHGTATQ